MCVTAVYTHETRRPERRASTLRIRCRRVGLQCPTADWLLVPGETQIGKAADVSVIMDVSGQAGQHSESAYTGRMVSSADWRGLPPIFWSWQAGARCALQLLPQLRTVGSTHVWAARAPTTAAHCEQTGKRRFRTSTRPHQHSQASSCTRRRASRARGTRRPLVVVACTCVRHMSGELLCQGLRIARALVLRNTFHAQNTRKAERLPCMCSQSSLRPQRLNATPESRCSRGALAGNRRGCHPALRTNAQQLGLAASQGEQERSGGRRRSCEHAETSAARARTTASPVCAPSTHIRPTLGPHFSVLCTSAV